MCGQVGIFDSSPLIALTQIDRLWLLPELFGTVVVPPAVVSETTASVGQPDWFISGDPLPPLDIRILEASLGAGESEAIALALHLNGEVVLDDRPARRLALRMGLPVGRNVDMFFGAQLQGLIACVCRDFESRLSHTEGSPFGVIA